MSPASEHQHILMGWTDKHGATDGREEISLCQHAKQQRALTHEKWWDKLFLSSQSSACDTQPSEKKASIKQISLTRTKEFSTQKSKIILNNYFLLIFKNK